MTDIRILTKGDSLPLHLFTFSEIGRLENGNIKSRLTPLPDNLESSGFVDFEGFNDLNECEKSDIIKNKYGLWNGISSEGNYHLKKANLPNQGSCYPRIYRPTIITDKHRQVSWDEYFYNADYNVITRKQIKRMFHLLDDICTNIWPHKNNLQAYGVAIRELIILICTEIEALWKGVLRANNHSGDDEKMTTNDYCKLMHPLQLGTYSVKFPEYPNLKNFKPFEKWDANKPTESLEFYKTYNEIKHDRENKLSSATLETAFETMAALIILAGSQMGPNKLETSFSRDNMFEFRSYPHWKAEEYYIPDTTWQERWYPEYLDFNNYS